MGLWQSRDDEISGSESVELYNVYEKNHDPALGEKILLHNSDDILQLSRLLPVIGKSDFHKAMAALGFPAGPLTVRKISIGKDRLTISGPAAYLPAGLHGISIPRPGGAVPVFR